MNLMDNKHEQFTDEFKEHAIRFVNDHPDWSLKKCAEHLKVDRGTLVQWKSKNSKNHIRTNRTDTHKRDLSELEKEKKRLKRELRDARIALEIFKKAVGIDEK